MISVEGVQPRPKYQIRGMDYKICAAFADFHGAYHWYVDVQN